MIITASTPGGPEALTEYASPAARRPRAWLKNDNEMVLVNAIFYEENVVDGLPPHILDEHNDVHLLDEVILMWPTYAKDRNRKVVYEADVVIAVPVFSVRRALGVSKFKGVVKYVAGAFMVFPLDGSLSTGLQLTDLLEMEVCGNLFEGETMRREQRNE